LSVLGRSAAIRRLAALEAISPLGDAVATVAIILHLQARGGTGTTVAAVMFAEAIPPVLAPFAGTLVDRVRDVRRLIASAAAAQAVVVGLIALALDDLRLPALAALLFVRAAIDTVSAPAVASTVPSVVADEDLESTNTTIAAVRELGSIVGPPLAGLLFVAFGAAWALALDAVTFLAVVPLVVTLRKPSRRVTAEAATWRADVADGLRLVWRTPALRAVAVGFWITVFVTAPDDLVLPFLGRDTFDARPVEIGLLLAGASLGLVVAAPFVSAIARRLSTPVAAIVAGGVVLATGNLLTAVAPAIAVAFGTQVMRGAGVALYDAAGVRTFLQRSTPPHLLGRALANVYGGVGVAAALGYVVGGPVLDATSPRVAFGIIGAGGFAGVASTVLLLRRSRASRS